MHKCVSDFLAGVCSQIKSKDLREAVRSELASHLLDKADELFADGASMEDASLMAVKSMGEPEEIGKKLAMAYKPDYKACASGILLFLAMMLLTFTLSRVNTLLFIDIPSLICVLVGAIALVLIGGYKNVPAEELLRRFSRMSVCSGIITCLIGFVAFLCSFSDVSSLGPNIAVAIISVFYGVIFSALAYALIPLTPTARIRRTPIDVALILN